MAIISPISISLLAETVATWRISSLVLISFESVFKNFTTSLTALSIPFLISVDLRPLEIDFIPSSAIDLAKIQVAVVPSPAFLLVFSEACKIIFAPSPSAPANVTALATVTPSFVTFGAPQDSCSAIFLPPGPAVVETISATVLKPASNLVLASSPLITFLICMNNYSL